MISVLIVSHDSREHLPRCLASLPLDDPERVETIVVDNASRDDSVALVRERFPSVRLIESEENLGFGAANNRAAAAARGDRLLLLNPDAWLAPGALDALDAALDADPRLGLVAPRLLYPDGRLQFSWVPESGVLGEALQMARNPHEHRVWNYRQVPPFLRLLTGPGWYSAACMLVRRAAFEEIGGFDERYFMYFEDVDLCRRLRLAGWRMAPAPAARVYHVKGAATGGTAFQLGYRAGQLRYYRQHRPRWEQRFLVWKLRRKFSRVEDPELRARLLALLDEDAGSQS